MNDLSDLILYERALQNGRTIQVIPLTYGRARLCIGPTDSKIYDDVW